MSKRQRKSLVITSLPPEIQMLTDNIKINLASFLRYSVSSSIGVENINNK